MYIKEEGTLSITNLFIRKVIWDKIRGIQGIKSVTTIGTANIIGNAISALFWLYLADLMGEESYGEIGYLISIAGIASAISLLGTAEAITVYTAKRVNIQPPIYLISITSSLIAAIVLFFYFENYGMSVYVIGYVIYSLTMAELLGRKLYKKQSIYFIIQKILFVVFSLLLYYVIGPQGVILGMGLSFIPFVNIIYKTIKTTKLNFAVFRTRIGFVMNNYVLDLSNAFMGSIDKILVGPLFGFAILGNYYLGLQILSLLMILPAIVQRYTLPEDSSGHPTGKIKILTVIASIVLALLGVFVAPIVLPVVFPEYQDLINLIPIMSLAAIPMTVSSMLISKLFGKEKSSYVLIARLLSLVVLITGIILLKDPVGPIGIAISLLLSSIVQAICLIAVVYVKRKSLQ